MDKVSVHIEVEVNPTESEQKVKEAVEKIFGAMNMQTKPLRRGSLLLAEATGQEALANFHNILQREHIRAAARGVLLQGLERRSVNFCLNKQVAYAGHVSFSQEVGESPLGPIKVKIKAEDPRLVVGWLTAMNP
ncbi:MAG: RNA-binding domain-containing protein [Candidatus Bathyarchaeia archaeon]|jgi:predicted RNA binding protein with dsRBD fold (UPF0201 family)